MIAMIVSYLKQGKPIDIEKVQDYGQKKYGILYSKQQIETLIKYVKG